MAAGRLITTVFAPVLALFLVQTSGHTQTNTPPEDTGIRMGRFVISPDVSVRERFDDNIYLTDDTPTSDVITEIAPRLRLQSEWRYLKLYVGAGAELGFYADSDDDNYQDADVRSGIALDIGPNTVLDGTFEWHRAHDARGGNDVPTNATKPVVFNDVRASLNAQHIAKNLHYQTELALRRLDFDDATDQNGNRIANDDRNRVESRETIRVLMPLDLGREAYGEFNLNQRQYDRTPDDDGRVRDSAGFQMLGGLRFDLTNLIAADVAAGWMTQSYADPAFGNIADYTLRADVNWAVTRLTSIGVKAARQVRETTLPGASGILAFDFGASVSHELRRFLSITADAHYTDEAFRQTTRHDRTTGVGLGMTYQLNRFARFDAGIAHDMRNSTSSGHDYRRFQTQFSLKLEM
ncbi:outer membrane beta-barrel protein [Thalassospira sp. GB04J01]|uniref:outer membrane beta-barrel protein n=1 Tax=Thalassospira sp. GB04J01 TaxID=1485225 RepID=UPI000C9C4646|nr:outer membrane beta-barrel protein [Thalassospira sp. GB04J01]|tara:strand:- start:22953 stop:24176 length:1224 start_codon:yes stop_codon:yes gene_type:complete